jgi:hypothetical protein
MPDGGKLTLETRHREIGAGRNSQAEAVKPGRYVELSVSDTGIGMDAQMQAHIFEPYFTTKPSGKGTGLGLSTVYGIVQQAGGYISFSSKLREGTTFRILLPQIDSAQAPGSSSDFPDASYSGEETVLLAEDEPAVCDLVRAILTSRGYTVLSARLPQEAERIAETRAKNRSAVDRRHHAWDERGRTLQADFNAHSQRKGAVYVRLHRRFGCAPGDQRKRDGFSAETVHPS